MTAVSRETSRTPLELGYSMPAEWEHHNSTWLAWPHSTSDWPGKLRAVEWVFAEVVKHIAAGETVRIMVNFPTHKSRARGVLRRAGAELSRVEFFSFPTNRSWVRDYGPVFVRRGEGSPEVAVSRFRFNGWARYPDWKLDDAVPELVAEALGLAVFNASSGERGFVLEGGAIDVNGRGTVICTEQCLLNTTTQARNPGLGQTDVEEALRNSLGVSGVFWLAGGIAGDDTNGHIDDVCRFVNPRTVVAAVEASPADANYASLRENLERLEDLRLEDGSKAEVVTLPMPAPLYFEGVRLPASYINFYICNNAVLVPTFNDPADRAALAVLGELFPGHSVVGVHCVDLVWGLGCVHCITREQPAVERTV